MSAAADMLTSSDAAEARRIWAEYQKIHDVSARRGETVGIDPTSGRMWFGDSALSVVGQMREEGTDVPLYFIRIGYDYYVRKGGRR